MVFVNVSWSNPVGTLVLSENGDLVLGDTTGQDDAVSDDGTGLQADAAMLTQSIESSPAGIIALDGLATDQASSIVSLAARVSSLEDAVSGLSTESAMEEPVQATPSASVPDVYEQAVTFLQGIIVRGYALIEGSLEVIGEATFRNFATFISDVIFQGNVQFTGETEFTGNTNVTGTVSFGRDTAGTAVIPKWATQVYVPFETPYPTPPVVTISLKLSEATDSAFLAEGANAGVADVSTAGFTIVLNGPVPRDLRYSWIALAVPEARDVMGESIEGSFDELIEPDLLPAENIDEATDAGVIETESNPESTPSAEPQ